MIYYDIDSVLNFGKFKGHTLGAVWLIDLGYVQWCLINLRNFFISEETYKKLQVLSPCKLNTPAENKIEYACFMEEEEYETPKTFENYAGYYAQDDEGYSDEDIEDIFGGDPDMYWNID